jgi:hypothetical protein
MPSGTHIPGWMGAAQRARVVATPKRDANADTHTDCDSYAGSHAIAGRERRMFSDMGSEPNLYRRQQSKPERDQLHRELLDAESKPVNQQWRSRQRAALDVEWLLRSSHAHSDS